MSSKVQLPRYLTRHHIPQLGVINLLLFLRTRLLFVTNGPPPLRVMNAAGGDHIGPRLLLCLTNLIGSAGVSQSQELRCPRETG